MVNVDGEWVMDKMKQRLERRCLMQTFKALIKNERLQ
jgi:hypothetical protein